MIGSKTKARAVKASFAIFLLMVYVTNAAADDGCEVLDRNGEPRDCSFSEKIADCFANATDSWQQCEEAAAGGNWFVTALESSACDTGYAVDLAACVPGAPIGWALGNIF